MNFQDLFKQAAESLLSYKLRTFLTLLGIIISVTSVVAVSSMIDGFNNYFEEKLANLGTRLIYLNRFSDIDYSSIESFTKASRSNKKLDEQDYLYLKEKLTTFEQIGIKTTTISPLLKKDNISYEDAGVYGSLANISEIEKIDVEEGRFFSETENSVGKRVAFIGRDVANNLSDDEILIGKTVKIGGFPYEIIGIGTPRGSFLGQSQDKYVVLPLKSFKRDFGDVVLEEGISILAKGKAEALQADSIEEIRFWMRHRRGLSSENEDTFGIQTMNDVIATRDRIYVPILFAALVIPIIVLFVGSTTVMNVMLVSVTERTKEIGVRKALGATKNSIAWQFLTEALLLCLFGGIISIFIAELLNQLVTVFIFPVSLSFLTICVAFFTSTVVGILAGLFPAMKAASLNPIKALESE
jgi:putative ABC transport system permease protein